MPPSPSRAVVCPAVCKYDLRRKTQPVSLEAPVGATPAEPVPGCSYESQEPSLPAPAKRMRKTRQTSASAGRGSLLFILPL